MSDVTEDGSERWLPIPGFPDYEISDLGRARSWRPFRGTPLPRILTPTPSSKGYLFVTPSADGHKRPVYLHRTVAALFIGPRPDGQEVRHLNGDQLNNARSNLAYGTPSANRLDAVRHGTHFSACREITHCPANHPYDAENTYMYGGRRYCRACRADRKETRRAVLRVTRHGQDA